MKLDLDKVLQGGLNESRIINVVKSTGFSLIFPKSTGFCTFFARPKGLAQKVDLYRDKSLSERGL